VGDLDSFYVHTVSVQTYQGTGAQGDVFAAAVVVPGWLEDKRRIVRDKDGQEVVSSSQFSCDVTHLAKFTPDSKVALPNRTAFVIGVASYTSSALELPDHLEIDLT
jgi:hypothetical protein